MRIRVMAMVHGEPAYFEVDLSAVTWTRWPGSKNDPPAVNAMPDSVYRVDLIDADELTVVTLR